MKRWLNGLDPQKSLAVLALAGLASFFVYLQFITKRAFLFDLYLKPTNFGTIVGANKLEAFKTFFVFLVLFALYLAAWQVSRRVSKKEGIFLIWGWALLLCIPMLLLYPYGARDIFDYIMRARVFVFYGENPYTQVSSVFASDPFFNYAWWKDYPSPYGPLWELTAGLGVKLAGNDILANISVFKFISIIFYIATGIFIFKTLQKHAPDRALAGTLLFLWNPLVLFEVVGNGHNDITMMVWIAASVWAVADKRWKLAIWFLAVGSAFKFISILLLPVIGLMALVSQKDNRARLKFLLISGAGCILIWVIAYLPFWQGFQTLTFLKQSSLLTTSASSILFYNFQAILGKNSRQIINTISSISTVVFALGVAVRVMRKPDWVSYARASTVIMLFYVLITCTWYQNWYLLWPLTTAVFLPGGKVMMAAVLFSVTGLVKPFVAMPLFSWLAKPGNPILQETRITLTTQGFSWIFSLILMVKTWLENQSQARKRKMLPVRPCLNEDLPAVVDLITQLAVVSGIKKEFSVSQFERLLTDMQSKPDSYANYVYLMEDKVVGFISVVFYQTFFHRVGTAQVNELVIDGYHRGMGIGKALMTAAENEARKRGMDELEVGTEKDNLEAQQFYRKYGFNEEYILFGKEFSTADQPPAPGEKKPS
jgi:ribosomal protein S18 acetylase RimI-like enzyme